MSTAHIIHVFPGFHLYYIRALTCLAQGHSHRRPSGSTEGRTREFQVTSPSLSHRATQDMSKKKIPSKDTLPESIPFSCWWLKGQGQIEAIC